MEEPQKGEFGMVKGQTKERKRPTNRELLNEKRRREEWLKEAKKTASNDEKAKNKKILLCKL